MKLEQHNEYTAQHGAIYEKYVFEIDPEHIVQWDQARVKGDNQKTYNNYLGQFLNGNKQLAPCSVVPLGNGKFLCRDGTTRAKAKKVANLTVPQKTLVSTFQHAVLHFAKEDWDDFQDAANDHPGAARSTDLDIEARIEERVKSGAYHSIYKKQTGKDLNINDSESVKTFIDVAGKHAANLNENAGRELVWFKNRVEKFLLKHSISNSGITTYNDGELVKSYKDIGGTKWSGNSIKDDQGGEHLFVLRRITNINPNLYGALVNHISCHPATEDFTVILSFTDVLKKKKEEVIADRDTVVESLIKVIGNIIKVGNTGVTIKHPYQIPSDKSGWTTLWESKVSSSVKLKAI